MALIKCKECGKEISDKANVCVHCGYELENLVCPECNKKISKYDSSCKNCGYDLTSKVFTSKNRDSYALVGMILGLCSIIAWIIPLIGYPCTIIGIIFSACAMGSNKKGMAITGLILSIIFLIVTLINSFIGMLMYM